MLDDTDRRRLHSAMRRRRFRRHEVVCHQGDPGDSLHVVVKGRLVATITSPATGLTARGEHLPARKHVRRARLLLGGPTGMATITAIDAAETLELERPTSTR